MEINKLIRAIWLNTSLGYSGWHWKKGAQEKISKEYGLRLDTLQEIAEEIYDVWFDGYQECEGDFNSLY